MKWSLPLALFVALTVASTQEAPKTPKIGDKAPAIRLNDQDGRAVAIGPRKDEQWSVLAFFPKASTPG